MIHALVVTARCCGVWMLVRMMQVMMSLQTRMACVLLSYVRRV